MQAIRTRRPVRERVRRGQPHVIDLAMREWSQPVGDGMIRRCLRERAPLLLNDVRTSSEYQVDPGDRGRQVGAGGPADGRRHGLGRDLNLEELVENAFDDEDAQLLCILANQVGAAMRSAQLVGQLGGAYSRSLNM